MSKHTGFTLLESMVAVTILAIAVAAPIYAANRALVAAQNANHQLTASYLAQEGIESVRLIRDNAYLGSYEGTPPKGNADTAWENAFLSNMVPCRGSNVCTLDPQSAWAPFIQCPGSGCAPLNRDGSDRYTPLSGTPTPYTRSITVDDIAGRTDEVLVTSEVKWSFHGTPYSVTITDHLTKWQP